MNATSKTLSGLRKYLTENFNVDELRSLAFALNVDFDNFAGGTRLSMAREMILYFHHVDRLQELVQRAAQMRPNILWSALADEDADIRETASETINSYITNSGVIAQGENSVAVGKGGIYISGNTTGDINTGSISLDNADSMIRASYAHNKGIELVNNGDWYLGLSLLEQSLAMRRDWDNLDDLADTIYEIGRTHLIIGNLEKSQTNYRDALRLYERTNNRLGMANAYAGIGQVLIRTSAMSHGVQALQSAKSIYDQLQNQDKSIEMESLLRGVTKIQELRQEVK